MKDSNSDQRRLEFPPTCHPTTVALYEYWLKTCGDRRMPLRSDIDPITIPRAALPGISLVEVVQDPDVHVNRVGKAFWPFCRMICADAFALDCPRGCSSSLHSYLGVAVQLVRDPLWQEKGMSLSRSTIQRSTLQGSTCISLETRPT